MAIYFLLKVDKSNHIFNIHNIFVITLILPNIDSNEESDTSNHQQETKDSNKIEILQIQMKI